MSNPENQQIFSTLPDNSYTNLLAQSVLKMTVKFECPIMRKMELQYSICYRSKMHFKALETDHRNVNY